VVCVGSPKAIAYGGAVNRKQLAHLFARVSRRSPGRAADVIDGLVYRMLKDFKRPFLGPISHRSTAAGLGPAGLRHTDPVEAKQGPQ